MNLIFKVKCKITLYKWLAHYFRHKKQHWCLYSLYIINSEEKLLKKKCNTNMKLLKIIDESVNCSLKYFKASTLPIRALISIWYVFFFFLNITQKSHSWTRSWLNLEQFLTFQFKWNVLDFTSVFILFNTIPKNFFLILNYWNLDNYTMLQQSFGSSDWNIGTKITFS